jgi:hypothetical protein
VTLERKVQLEETGSLEFQALMAFPARRGLPVGKDILAFLVP